MRKLDARVVTLLGPRKLSLSREAIDLDKIGADEVAAETISCAISPGTEIAAYRGDPPLGPGKAYPRVIGYCNVAEVIEKGRNVIDYEVGNPADIHRTMT